MNDEMKREIQQLKGAVGELTGRVNAVAADVGVLKNDVGVLKTDVGVLKTDVGSLSKQLKSVTAEVARNSVKIDDLQSLAVSTKSSVDRLVGAVESFTKDIEAAQRDRTSSSNAYMEHQRLLDDHETRLSKLESKD